jgi:hypothetical protein
MSLQVEERAIACAKASQLAKIWIRISGEAKRRVLEDMFSFVQGDM